MPVPPGSGSGIAPRQAGTPGMGSGTRRPSAAPARASLTPLPNLRAAATPAVSSPVLQACWEQPGMSLYGKACS